MAFEDHRPASWPNTSVSAVDAESINVSGQDHTLTRASRAIWVGGTGDVDVTFRGGTRVTIPSVPAGTLLHIQVTKVWDLATTASGLVAWY